MRYYCQVWIYGFSQATDPPCFPSPRNVELLLLDKETRVRRLKCPCLRLRLWRLKWLTLTRLLAWTASASCEPVMQQRRPCAPGPLAYNLMTGAAGLRLLASVLMAAFMKYLYLILIIGSTQLFGDSHSEWLRVERFLT